jgi:hypothetical protein
MTESERKTRIYALFVEVLMIRSIETKTRGRGKTYQKNIKE